MCVYVCVLSSSSSDTNHCSRQHYDLLTKDTIPEPPPLTTKEGDVCRARAFASVPLRFRSLIQSPLRCLSLVIVIVIVMCDCDACDCDCDVFVIVIVMCAITSVFLSPLRPPSRLCHFPPPSPSSGVLPQVVKTLLELRRDAKEAMKKESNPSVVKQLDVRQKALKLVANSMYGCLGFPSSRFYCKPLASLITQQGKAGPISGCAHALCMLCARMCGRCFVHACMVDCT